MNRSPTPAPFRQDRNCRWRLCWFGFFAIFHGHAHGTELPPDASGLTYIIGFVISTGCLHLVGIELGLVYEWRTGQCAVRLIGVGVAIAGAIFLSGILA